MHRSAQPVTLIASSISPGARPRSGHFAIREYTLMLEISGENKLTVFAVLHPIYPATVQSNITRFTRPFDV
jgi:hypothetical protein